MKIGYFLSIFALGACMAISTSLFAANPTGCPEKRVCDDCRTKCEKQGSTQCPEECKACRDCKPPESNQQQ